MLLPDTVKKLGELMGASRRVVARRQGSWGYIRAMERHQRVQCTACLTNNTASLFTLS